MLYNWLILGVKTERIMSDPYLIHIRKIKYIYQYMNTRMDTDTDMIICFIYLYQNSRYISYILIYIMKKIILFTIIIYKYYNFFNF